MSIDKISLASLSKRPNEQTCVTQFIDLPTPLNDDTLSHIYSIKQAFLGRTTKQYGTITLSDAAPLGQVLLNTHLKPDTNTYKSALTLLDKTFAETDMMLNSHLLFFTESQIDNTYVYVLFLQLEQALTVQSNLSLVSQLVLNERALQMGVRLTLPNQPTTQYECAFLGNRMDKLLTAWLTEQLGLTANDQKAQTKEFVQVVEAYTKNMPAEEEDDVKAQIINFCVEQEKAGEAITYVELGEKLASASRPNFTQFVQSNTEITPDTIENKITPKSSELKKMVKFSGRERGLSVSFSSEFMREFVQYDANSDQLIIRKVPKALKVQLMRSQVEEAE